MDKNMAKEIDKKKKLKELEEKRNSKLVLGGISSYSGYKGYKAGETLSMLQQLGEIPFLPVARRADSMNPIYLEDQKHSVEEYSAILQVLEQKGLITLDYDLPIKGFHDQRYHDFPVVGSFALSARGQQVLELLDVQGIQ